MNVVEVKRLTITDKLRNDILKRDGYACRYCGSKISPFHLDHVYPVIKGGETSKENLVTACVKCNQEKGHGVGIYPKPVGYFKKRDSRLILLTFILIVWNIIGLYYLSTLNNETNPFILLILIIVPSFIALYAQYDYISTGK